MTCSPSSSCPKGLWFPLVPRPSQDVPASDQPFQAGTKQDSSGCEQCTSLQLSTADVGAASLASACQKPAALPVVPWMRGQKAASLVRNIGHRPREPEAGAPQTARVSEFTHTARSKVAPALCHPGQGTDLWSQHPHCPTGMKEVTPRSTPLPQGHAIQEP